MPTVNSNNYNGNDRRRNGARLKLSVGDWLRVGSFVVLITLFIGYNRWTCVGNAKTIEAHEVNISANCNRSRDNLKDILSIKEDIGEIKQDIKVLLMYQKRNHDEYN